MAQALEALAGALEEIPGMLSAAAAQGLKNSLERVAEDARMRAPVDTGTLRNSIAADAGPTERGAEGTVRADTVYAKAVEYGAGELPAHPFLYPALKAAESQIPRDIHSAIRRAIEKQGGAIWR